MAHLLIVEDDAALRLSLTLALEDEGHAVTAVERGDEALAAISASTPDLVLLDIRLPDMSGLEVCRTLRRSSLVPVVMVTANSDTHDVVAGLEAGADDYVTKPVSIKALAARVRAHLRRASWSTPDEGQDGTSLRLPFGLELRPQEGTLLRDGAQIPLTKTEYRLMCEFASRPNQLLSRDHLLEHVWGYEYVGDGRLVDTHIRRLRAKVEPNPDSPQLIVTARGLGYRMVTGADDAPPT